MRKQGYPSFSSLLALALLRLLLWDGPSLGAHSFAPTRTSSTTCRRPCRNIHHFHPVKGELQSSSSSTSNNSSSNGIQSWNGEVVTNGDGRIRGCTIQPAKPGSLTEWTLQIDGVEADLGRFSEAIYKKVIGDAKRQSFQGFRPGTIPPHLQPTYKAYAMDECARETVLEALQQNNIRPFSDARSEMILEQFQIPSVTSKGGSRGGDGGKNNRKKNKKAGGGGKNKSAMAAGQQDEDNGNNDSADQEQQPVSSSEVLEPQWRSFETMKEAIDAGWKPGQSFSFRATNVRGQRVKEASEIKGATPLGRF